MTLVFRSDPHLGLNRTSHTTPASRQRLQDALFKQTENIVTGSDTYICLGDLFDTTDNSEAIIAQGAKVAVECKLVLSGNHDLPNRDGRMSSLQLIGELAYESAIAISDDDTWAWDSMTEFTEARLFAVPHKRTQELFEATLKQLWENTDKSQARPNILLLHCNYDSGYATDDASLNLTRDNASNLLDVFDYILIGHEHIPRSDFGGRLQILGNIHPTSFSDISDKFIWRFEDGKLKAEQVWEEHQHVEMSWEGLLSMDSNWGNCQFIEIKGTAPATKLPEIAKAIQKLWSQAPDALMIRNNVKSEEIVVETKDLTRALDIPSKITHDLAGTVLAPVWARYLEKVA